MPIAKNRILYEDDDLLIVNKRSKELTVRGAGRVGKLPLFDFLLQEYPAIVAVHRLDFETSGTVVFAKSAEVLEMIRATNFEGWQKVYTALVMGRVDRKAGTVRKRLEPRTGGKVLVDAETQFTVLEKFGNSSLVEATIETGRYHQIRKHMAFLGHPLVLDHVYGHKKFNQVFTREFRQRNFFLHASRLVFPHPRTGKRVEVECPLPPLFAGIVKTLRSLM